MSEDAVDEPARKADPEPGRQPPVGARVPFRIFFRQTRPDAPVAPPEKTQQKNHAQAETHQTMGIEHIQVKVVRMADGDFILERRKPQRAEGRVVLSGPGPEPGMFQKNAPAQIPEAPAAVVDHVFRRQALRLAKDEQPQGQQRPEQNAPLPAPPAQQGPEAERRGHSQHAAAAGRPLQQKKGRPEDGQAEKSGTHGVQTPAQDKPEAESRDQRQSNVIAHRIVAQAAGQPSGVARVAHDEIPARGRLPDAVQALPEAGQRAGPDQAAQILFVAHAFHGDEGQDKALVDASARVQQGRKGVCGKTDADADHQPEAIEQPARVKTAQHAVMPFMAVIEQQKNKAEHRHDLAHAVANGERGQREPERPEQAGEPEFTRPFAAHGAPGLQNGCGPTGRGRENFLHHTSRCARTHPSPYRLF